ncbi:MAG TPA: tRNA epoxyqueuosine(34) reductase QueG [Phycisphaerae bacterium]|nr:tRNA epoxyqueuosine(34) reductase QueG [Phycisphaerae bacterium]
MTDAERSNWIKRAAAQIGFGRCGIAPASEIPRANFVREWLAKGYAGTMGYLQRHVESRVDVRAWLPSARSVIVVALNYAQRAPPKPNDAPRGRVAMYAWGEDYHVVVREKLDALVARMREQFPEPFEAKVCVDTSAIIERELAAMAGIGWIGKNTMVLHPDLGSYFFLGVIITDLPLAPDAPEPDHCGSCTRCLEACPTQAFPQAYVMDARRCISYLTIEHRSEIVPELAEKMGDWVFGCDICQEVCPYNREVRPTTEREFAPHSTDAVWPPLKDIAAWDEHAYRDSTQGKATDRARLEMWRRNGAIAARPKSTG